MSDTIAAVSTPLGVGGIGIVRISGDEAISVADKMIRLPSGKKVSDMKGYSCSYARIYEAEGEIDEAIVSVFYAPHSYTGENIVEIAGHGGIYLVKHILRTACDNGARLALAGEFTKQAFLNGKLDLTEAEAVVDLIAAQGKYAARAALSARDGVLFHKLDSIGESLLDCDSQLSAWIDYPEEDLTAVDREKLGTVLKCSAADLRKLLDTYDVGKIVREGIETAIVGKPNTGKSTLMNLLSGYNRSIVTDMAGTTRDIVSDQVHVGDWILQLSDTAGIRESDDIVEREGVRLAEDRLKKAQLILAVFDGAKSLDENDMRVIEGCKDAPTIAIINKNDLQLQIDMNIIKEAFQNIVFVSAKTGDGEGEIKSAIERIFELEHFDPASAVIANERQRAGIVKAVSELNDAILAIDQGMSFDAVGVCIDGALGAILELTGKRAVDEVINQVFSRFCVGK